MVKFVIERGRKWKIEELLPKTIALDGAVPGPHHDSEKEIFSFDHHESCIRGITLSSCEQVQEAVMMGLDPNGFMVVLNDIDLDSALSAWLLQNPNRVSEPQVAKLVNMAGRMDAHSGAYPIEDGSWLELDWIAEPETKIRKDGSYEQLSNAGLMVVLEAIFHRIEQYADSRVPASAQEQKQEDGEQYEILKKGSNFYVVKMLGDRCLRGMARAKISRFVAFRELEDKTLKVTIGKRSEYVTNFPITQILSKLQGLEPKRNELDDRWGGSTTIGGSPRNSDGSGTKISLDDIFATVEQVVRKKTASKRTKK